MTQTQPYGPEVENYRLALLRTVAALFFMAGLDEGGNESMPRRAWRKILRLLRPAEAAARRLIVAAARGIAVPPPKPRPERELTGIERLQAKGLLTIREVDLGLARFWRPEDAAPEKPPRLPAFPLADAQRRFDTLAWDGKRPFPKEGVAPADDDEEIDAAPISRRIEALRRALDDLDGHARRLARREARLAAWDREKDPKRKGAYPGRTLRLGPPPGQSRKDVFAVDEVLRECHSLALQALRAPDTS